MSEPTPKAPNPDSSAASALSVSAALTIHTAQDQGAAWLAALRAHPAARLDLSNVSSCDALGIQLLLALRRSAAQSGKRVTLANPSAAVRRAAEAVGCTDLFPTSLPQ